MTDIFKGIAFLMAFPTFLIGTCAVAENIFDGNQIALFIGLFLLATSGACLVFVIGKEVLYD